MKPTWISIVMMMVACVQPAPSEAPDAEGGDDPVEPGCGALSAVAGHRLQSIVELGRIEARSLGMTLGVQQGCRRWSGSSGDATLDPARALEPTDRFRIYSITKTFTAAIVLRLVDRGELSLEDPISRWYPNLPNAGTIRIRHLLAHTSGLYDCLVDDAVVAGRHDVWDHDELIEIAGAHGARFAPGAKAEYVNTNYLLLGRIIEHVTGRTYARVLRDELLDPLNLRDTFLVGDDTVQLPYVQGTKHTLLGNFEDATTAWHDSLTWSAGGLVSSASDQLTWFTALFDGRTLSEQAMHVLVDRETLADGSLAPTGHGVMVTDSAAGPYYWHDGGGSGIGLLGTTAFGFHAHVGLLRDHELVLSVLANTGTSDVNKVRDAAMRYLVLGNDS
jgi:D-alanyl-D-alanine carboxypeptidase